MDAKLNQSEAIYESSDHIHHKRRKNLSIRHRIRIRMDSVRSSYWEQGKTHTEENIYLLEMNNGLGGSLI